MKQLVEVAIQYKLTPQEIRVPAGARLLGIGQVGEQYGKMIFEADAGHEWEEWRVRTVRPGAIYDPSADDLVGTFMAGGLSHLILRPRVEAAASPEATVVLDTQKKPVR